MAARSYFLPEDLGLQSVHQRPYVAGADKVIVKRMGVVDAWENWHRLELNPPHAYAAILLDVDKPSEQGWRGLPNIWPSWLVLNEKNGHSHLGYALAAPVARHQNATLPPLRKLAHVADRLCLYLGGDPGYTGLITRNPLNPGPGCSTWQPELWLRTHTLDSLDAAIPKSVKPLPEHRTGIGRNVDLFGLMVSEVFRPRWADRLKAEGWNGAWVDHVQAVNEQENQDHPHGLLPDAQVRAIAKSCFRYWTRQYSASAFSARQRARMGQRWHGSYAYDFDGRDASILALRELGMKHREIAEIVEVGKRRVGQVLKKEKGSTITVIVPFGVKRDADLLTPNPSQKGDGELLAYLPPTSWRIVTICTLCDQDSLHNPGAVLCLRCGILSIDAQGKHSLPLATA